MGVGLPDDRGAPKATKDEETQGRELFSTLSRMASPGDQNVIHEMFLWWQRGLIPGMRYGRRKEDLAMMEQFMHALVAIGGPCHLIDRMKELTKDEYPEVRISGILGFWHLESYLDEGFKWYVRGDENVITLFLKLANDANEDVRKEARERVIRVAGKPQFKGAQRVVTALLGDLTSYVQKWAAGIDWSRKPTYGHFHYDSPTVHQIMEPLRALAEVPSREVCDTLFDLAEIAGGPNKDTQSQSRLYSELAHNQWPYFSKGSMYKWQKGIGFGADHPPQYKKALA